MHSIISGGFNGGHLGPKLARSDRQIARADPRSLAVSKSPACTSLSGSGVKLAGQQSAYLGRARRAHTTMAAASSAGPTDLFRGAMPKTEIGALQFLEVLHSTTYCTELIQVKARR